MLTVVLILSALGAVAVKSQPLTSLNTANEDPLSLALAVESTFKSLSNGQSGADLTAGLMDIVVKADILLAFYGYKLGESAECVQGVTSGHGAGLVLAVSLNGDLTQLSQYASKLKQAVDSGDNSVIVENIISIRVTASRIICAMSSFNIDNIRYDLANRGQEILRGKRDGGIHIKIGPVEIDIHWGKKNKQTELSESTDDSATA